MSEQLGFGFGTRHVCAHDVRKIRQCGTVWECDEPGCLGAEQERCVACANFPSPHSIWWVNRAKREPDLAAKLQRMAARTAAA